jgi:HSP20 family protein
MGFWDIEPEDWFRRRRLFGGGREVRSDDPQRKYHQVIELPPEADIETAKSVYKNGILEIIFDKKKESKAAGKNIKVE